MIREKMSLLEAAVLLLAAQQGVITLTDADKTKIGEALGHSIP